MFGALDINCGDPECCPEPRGDHYVSGAFGYSTVKMRDDNEEEMGG